VIVHGLDKRQCISISIVRNLVLSTKEKSSQVAPQRKYQIVDSANEDFSFVERTQKWASTSLSLTKERQKKDKREIKDW
jgi:DNA-binding HxlR family transcriptional regulator